MLLHFLLLLRIFVLRGLVCFRFRVLQRPAFWKLGTDLGHLLARFLFWICFKAPVLLDKEPEL